MGAFGGFLGGLSGGISGIPLQNGQQGKQGGAQSGTQSQGSSPLTGLMNGQWSILPIIKNALGGGAQQPQQQSTVPGQNPANAQQPINTQTALPHAGFNGLIPMVSNYYHNHEAKIADSAAQTHVQALQDPNLTPEQRGYHITNLQHIYANRPDVLKQMGIPAPGGQNIPAVPAASAPTAAGGK